MNGRMAGRATAAAACAALTLAAMTGCHSNASASASGGNKTPSSVGTGSTAGAAGGGSGSGVCSYLTTDDAAGFFTGPVNAGVAGTDSFGPGSIDCFYHLQSDNAAGLDLGTKVDWDFWKGQFSVLTPMPGVGDEAYVVNNGLAVLAKKGSTTCFVSVQFSKTSEVSVPVDDGGAVAAPQRDAFDQQLGAICSKVLG